MKKKGALSTFTVGEITLTAELVVLVDDVEANCQLPDPREGK